ncbi:MAG: 50S ribosomal protein L30e [Candidatus Altiarchaeales archaeon]|nr:50S ribosomal protein L30e [Candidatus Altiarchaeales archaeon]
MKDLSYELGVASRTGKLVLGFKNVVSQLLTGSPKLVIVSESSPKKVKEAILYYSQLAKVKCIKAKQTSLELGSNCGKPFPISAIAVLDAGDSDLL